MKTNKLFMGSITFQSLKLIFSASPMLSASFIVFEVVFCIIPIFSAKVISQIINIFTALDESQFKNLIVLFLLIFSIFI